MPNVRTVRTSSAATAVQIVHSSHRGSRKIEHLGSAPTPDNVEALQAAWKQRIEQGQAKLDLGLEVAAPPESGRPLEIVGSRTGHLWHALSRAYDALGSNPATGADEVFRQLLLAWIITLTSKVDSTALWVPRIASTLTSSAPGGSVGQPCRVGASVGAA